MPSTLKPKKKMKRAERQAAVARLYAEKVTQTEIAKILGTTQSTISKDIRSMIDTWKESAQADITEFIAQTLNEINTLEVTYWEAWKESCKDEETSISKVKGLATVEQGMIQASPVEKTSKAVSKVGNPQFLSGVQWCIDKRIKLLGLDKPEKVEILVKAYETVSPDDWDE